MSTPCHLPKAPITEALIDLRIKPKEGLTAQTLGNIYNTIRSQYPNREELLRAEAQIEFRDGQFSKLNSGKTPFGYLYKSADKKQILQAKLDGFTFNRLAPYENWSNLRDEAYRLWQNYAEITNSEIIRVAVRYINKIDIPLPIENFGDYLTAAPIVPQALPQGVSSFLTRVVIQEPALDVTAIITQSLEQIVNPNLISIILDIDVFKQNTIGIYEKEAWELLEELHNFKNKIFFESITEKLKEAFI
ncbi:MAG: TIGR04255 family protein [Candidatus Schekmanbacteria bacterium]|nr:TIGR04255 family protein [Candidatus Schekmanbacteria bacterium]